MDEFSDSQLMNMGLNLPLDQVASICSIELKNGKLNPLYQICKSEKFWKRRFEQDYGKYGPPPQGMKYYNYYTILTKLWNLKVPGTNKFFLEESALALLDPERKLPDRIALLYPVPLLTLEGKQEGNKFRGTVKADLLIISLPGLVVDGREMAIMVHSKRSSIRGDIPGVDQKLYYSNRQIIRGQSPALQGKIEQLIEQLKISGYVEVLADFPMFVDKDRIPILIKRAHELGYVTFDTKAKFDADPSLFENKVVQETATSKPITNYDYKPATRGRMNQVPVDELERMQVTPASPKAQRMQVAPASPKIQKTQVAPASPKAQKKEGIFSFLAPARADDFDDWMK